MPRAADYVSNGVSVAPHDPAPDDTLKITYNGLLSTNGATEVYAHIGFNREWENVNDYKMRKTKQGFTTSLLVPQYARTINFCFKDSSDNWDNNSGANYSVELTDRASDYSVTQAHRSDVEAAEEILEAPAFFAFNKSKERRKSRLAAIKLMHRLKT